MRFRHVSASETNEVSATFLLSHFPSFLFPLRIFSFSFDCEINMSEILPLRTIKVNKGKFAFEIVQEPIKCAIICITRFSITRARYITDCEVCEVAITFDCK